MKIDTVTIQGFRCFGDQPTTVDLSDGITVLIGANGSGKTAFIHALLRMFGISRSQRSVKSEDFYLPPGKTLDDFENRKLSIDIRIIFPELQHQKDNLTVPPFFRHMAVTELGTLPFIRARLEAVWENGLVLGGSVEEKLSWILSDDDNPPENLVHPITTHERNLIQIHYIPATRDVSASLGRSTEAMASRLLRAVEWSDDTKLQITDSVRNIRKAFASENAIQHINTILERRWKELHRDVIHANPELHTIGSSFSDVIRRLAFAFSPNEQGHERLFSELSDGQKSLFYFSLVAAVFDIENMIRSTIADKGNGNGEMHNIDDQSETRNSSSIGFDSTLVRTPCLTVFAFEEPENHLSPYYLTRIIEQVRSLSGTDTAQAVLTSHSSGILGRIAVDEIRHLRLQYDSRTVIPKSILLPSATDDVAKYLREAVHAFPELYFARFVILGEGDSERVVLPHIAQALGLSLDSSFVAMVPLGGRHVNHFWRLLNDLDIPHATLLDLDLGRSGGGWGRIKYVLKQLLAIDKPEEDLLNFVSDGGHEMTLTSDELEYLHEKADTDLSEMQPWLDHLERHGVFFSKPLDLDLAMLAAFPEKYKATAPALPSLSVAEAARKILIDEDLKHYEEDIHPLFPWYNYLFHSRSKPSTHLQAMSIILSEPEGRSSLATDAPPELKHLLKQAEAEVTSREEV